MKKKYVCIKRMAEILFPFKAYRSLTLGEECVVFAQSRAKARWVIFKCLDETYMGFRIDNVGPTTRDKELDQFVPVFKRSYCYRRDFVTGHIERAKEELREER